MGFDVIQFAEVIGEPLLPWQQWLVKHALELTPDGTYRFRTVVVLVARQNGKSTAKRIVSLWRLYVDGAKLVLGVAQDVSLAREQWSAAIATIEGSVDLAVELDTVRRVNGDEWFRVIGGGRYKIAAANRSAGRGLSVDELTIDELREQRSWDAWSALSKTTMARRNGQIWAMSNAGDDESVVLNSLRDAALSGRDPSIGLFEWSAPDGCDLDDPKAWAAANPALGQTLSEQAIRSAMGTDPPAVFRCLDVATPILTPHGWASMGALAVGDQVKGTTGRWANVVGVSPVSHGRTCYRVTLNDGRSLVCDDQHLWTVADRRRPGPPETLSTQALIARGVTYRNPSMCYDVRNFSLPVVAPLDGPVVDLPINPYLLGLWLGDGAGHAAMVFVEDRDEGHTRARMEVCGAVITTRARDSEHCWRLGFQVGRRGRFTGALHDLGVYRNKHIPDLYLTASFEQRLELLRGLMDSDGTVSRGSGRCIFTNTSDKLVVGVRSLVRSLGWKTSDLPPGQYGEGHHLARYDVAFTPRPHQPTPATIPRKVAHIRAARSYRDVRPATIVSIEPVPSVPVRCIEVDTPDSLFLAGDLIPTHNTEVLCQRVDQLDGAVDLSAWRDCADATGTLSDHRERVVACVDVSPDGAHVTLAAAALVPDGRVRVEVVAAWHGTDAARAELPDMLARVRPQVLGWFPAGPAAALAPLLRAHRASHELTGHDVGEACQGLADLARARRVLHPEDPLLNNHIAGAKKLDSGDGWRFVRRGTGHVDAAYAAAGAVHLALTMPPAPKLRVRMIG